LKLALALLALIALPAFAADISVSWVNPTRDVDNVLLPATGPQSLASTRVQYGSCSGTAFGTAAGQVIVPAPATTTTISGLPSGSTYCVRAFSRNVAGDESAASNVVSRVIPTVPPQPPVLSSTVNIVWEQRRLWIFSYLAQVGTAPIGSACEANETRWRGQTYNGIDVDLVKLSTKVDPRNLYTRCA